MITLNFTLDELRALAKSVSKTRDAELKKLLRITEGTKFHADVKTEFMLVDTIDSKIGSAISEAVIG